MGGLLAESSLVADVFWLLVLLLEFEFSHV